MKDIIIIAQYLRLEKENGNSRFTYLAKMLQDYKVEIVTSAFMHGPKKHRDTQFDEENNYKITILDEPGYHKNFTLKRFYSHYILSRNLKRYLRTRKKPDLIFCAVPSFDVGLVASNYCQKNNIPFVVDIQDLWPEAFKMAFNIPLLSDLVFLPFKMMANKVYKYADEIVAVSETYKNRGLSVNKKKAKGLSVFLGTELDTFDKHKDSFQYRDKPHNEIWLAYIGTLGHSYNINDIIDAFEILKEKGLTNIKFKVLGDGPLMDSFLSRAKDKDIECEFLGRKPYPEMVEYITNCDVAVNPIVESSSASIINKVGDYAAAGLPVINTQPDKEYRQLVEKYNVGFNCKNGDIKDISEKIEKLYEDEKLRFDMGNNNRKLAEEKFDRKYTYPQIIELIKNLLN